MVTIAICDDDEWFVDILNDLINKYTWKEKYAVDSFSSISEMLKSVYEGKVYDIIIMDIVFSNEQRKGTDTARMIKRLSPDSLIIYVSSYDCYSNDIMQAEPFRFLKKPVDKMQLNTVMDTAYQRIRFNRKEYLYNFGGEIRVISLKEVDYIYSQHRKIYFHKRNGEEDAFYHKLDDLEKEIESIYPFFARANKSYLVNINSVQRVTPQSAILYNDEYIITVSENYKKEFIRKIFEL